MLIWFVSDIHEDAEALKRWIDLLKTKWCEKIICLWDIIDFSDKSWCIWIIKSTCDDAVIWNHDFCAIKRIPESALWFNYPENRYELPIEKRVQLASDKIRHIETQEEEDTIEITDSTKDYLNSLSEYKILTIEGINILLSHWTYPNLSWCWRSSDEVWLKNDIQDKYQHCSFMEKHHCAVSFVGHEHDRNEVYTRAWRSELQFEKAFTIKATPCCFSVPAIWYCNSTKKQWVATFDTQKMEVLFLGI